MDYRSFLQREVPQDALPGKGQFFDESGTFLGWHEGYPFWNIVDTSRLLNSEDVIVRIRYRKQANHCTVSITDENLLHVLLREPLESIASGQAAAFYDEAGLLLGGGIIL